ncbi:hypothetical protein CEXT_176141 [Caerostris extrusa]|uniref:Uncharacterized protein n=1 Tax=Caerostris extrusa TaxID=172846 RepID=A0AAV4US46_CAEEX|nr:hypothetical protein CEXT_176141 [Caerostris extrusa]
MSLVTIEKMLLEEVETMSLETIETTLLKKVDTMSLETIDKMLLEEVETVSLETIETTLLEEEVNFNSCVNFNRAGNAPVLHVYDTAKAVRYERLSKTGKICAPGLERPLHGSGGLCIIKSGAPLWERINLSGLCPDTRQPRQVPGEILL